MNWIKICKIRLNKKSNDYTKLTKKRLNWIKQIKLSKKLPSDYIQLIKKDQTEWKRLNQIKNCSD